MASRARTPFKRAARPTLVARVLATIAAWLLSTTALAAPSGPSAADRETARSLLEQGRALSDQGNQQEALKRFKGADDIMHVPSTAIRVAKAQAALGLLVEARDTISQIQRMPMARVEPQPFKDARAEAEQLDATLAPRIPSLTITVTGAAAGEDATLTVDGVDLPAGVIGLPRVVDPGHHVIAAKTPTTAGTQEIDIKEAEQKKVEIGLVSTGTVAPVVADQGTPPATTTKKSHSPTVVTWAGAGLAGAGLIVGTVTGVMVLSKKSTLKGECTNDVCPAGNSDLSSANTLATVSTVGFIAAGVGAAVAIVSLAVGHNETVAASEPGPADPAAAPEPAVPAPPEARIHIVPWFAGFAGGVGGTF
jgi:hypothetical protein